MPAFKSKRKGRKRFFVMSLRLSDHKVIIIQHRIFVKFFFLILLGFSRFLRSYFIFKFSEFKEFNKTIIPFTLVGYETGYSQLISNARHGIIVKYCQEMEILTLT